LKIVLLNASPKPGKGASSQLLDYLKTILEDSDVVVCHLEKEATNEILAAAQGAGALLFAFGLYVDSLPAPLLRFLEECEAHLSKVLSEGAKIYAIINNGFYEAHQNAIASDILRLFADKAGVAYGYSLLVGAGGMIGAAPIGQGPFTKIAVALKDLSTAILTGGDGPDVLVHPSIPRFVYFMLANLGMTQKAKANGLSRKDVKMRRE